MKRIWITGAAGHVGSALTRHLNRMEYEIIPTDRDDVDVSAENQVQDYASINRPDVIINCAGFTDVAACEANVEGAYRVNAIGARNLAVAAQKTGAKLVQISTDDVFDGTAQRPYNEFDPVGPRSVYGKSKLAGEEFVKTMVNRYLIIRSSWVYGTGEDFVDYVLGSIGKQDRLEIPNNQFAAPTSAKEIAQTIARLIDGSEYGVYHVVCKGSCSRYEFAREILKKTKLDHKLEIYPVISQSADRPTYSVLDNMMLRITGIEEPKEWTAALSDYIIEVGGKLQ